jgi:hypothetical protein
MMNGGSNLNRKNFLTSREREIFELLVKNYDTEEIADRLNRSENSVRIVLRELGYSYKMPIHWKGKELKYLRENYKDMSYEEKLVVNSFMLLALVMPTVDAVEVVHGEWNICEDDYNDLVYHTCSNCGAEYTTDYGVDLTWKFCPNCGAKMDGGDKE